jgi:hypothetical protein
MKVALSSVSTLSPSATVAIRVARDLKSVPERRTKMQQHATR